MKNFQSVFASYLTELCVTPGCVPLKEVPDVKGQNFYPGVCSLFFFQIFVISIFMSNENQFFPSTLQPFWNAAFKTRHLYKLLTPLQQHEHVSPAITADGQILAPLLWVYLCSQSHWNNILSQSTSLLPEFITSPKNYKEKRAFLDLCKSPEWSDPQ